MRMGRCAVLVGVIAVAGCTKGQGTTPDTTQAATTAGHTAAATPSPSDARHAIDSADTRMAGLIERGDAKTAAAMYTSDAIADFPGAPIMNGSDAIAKAWEQQAGGATFKDAKLHTDDLLTGGDLAVENGTWSWTATPKGGKAEGRQGRRTEGPLSHRLEASGGWHLEDRARLRDGGSSREVALASRSAHDTA